MNDTKLIAMDLDGTLTQCKTEIDEKNRAILQELSKKYKLLIVGSGQVMSIFNQLRQFPLDIVGNYGLQYGVYQNGGIHMVRNMSFECDKDAVEEKVNYLRKKYGFTKFVGDGVEYHPSGCVTFPILGTKAVIDDKLKFDPDKSKRRKIYHEVSELFSEYSVFLGGSSSFDMVPKPYNKYIALDTYCKDKEYSHENIIYIGDDYGMCGNDEPIYLSDFNFLKINDYRTFENVVADLL